MSGRCSGEKGRGLNICLQIGLGTLLFLGIVAFLFKKPWGNGFKSNLRDLKAGEC